MSLFSKRHNVIIEYSNVMDALEAISSVKQESKIYKFMNMEIGNCGLTEEPTKWFITFDCTHKQWKSIITRMNDIGYEFVLKPNNSIYLNLKN